MYSLYNDKGYVIVTMEDLVNEGLINSNLINPETNKKIELNEQIKVSLDATGLIEIEYPAEEVLEDYLKAMDIIIEYNKDTIGAELSSYCNYKINSIELAYVDKGGSIVGEYLNESTIKCSAENVDTSKIGTYELRYEYLVRGTNEWKQARRKVIVSDNIAPTKPEMSFEYTDGRTYNGEWTKEGIRTRISGPSGSEDSGTGIEKYQISKDGVNWIDYNYNNSNNLYNMTTTQEHTRYFRACDKAGNCGEIISVVGKIDKAAPEISTQNTSNIQVTGQIKM